MTRKGLAMPRLRSIRFALTVVLTFVAAAGSGVGERPVFAQPAAPTQAQRFLETRHAEVDRVLRQGPGDARNRRLGTLLDNLLDYPELARRALGRHWEGRSAAERREFSELLEQLVARSYQDNLQRTLSFEVDYLGAEPVSEGVLVKTRARDRRNRRAQPVEIDYSMHRVGDAWRVYDVHTDGVSLVENYRSQFNRIIDREGFPGLLTKMRTRLENGSDAI
jgi:phospholipid transport system substrate-binding protein